MNLLMTLRVAARAILRNKLRSFLTALGIIFGVGAVIAMVSIGEGAKSRVEQAFASMGSNMLVVLSGSATSGGSHGGFGSMPTLTWDDLRGIQTEIPSVRYAAPMLNLVTQAQSDGENWTTRIYGTTPECFLIRQWPMANGNAMTQSDVDVGAKIALIGQTVVDKLFGANANPVGQTVRIKGVPFEIVAVLSKKGQSPIGQDYDDAIFVPVTTFQTRLQGGLQKYINGIIYVSAASADDVDRAETEIGNLLRDRHHIVGDTDDDFAIRNLTEMATATTQSTRTLTTLLACIAAVSLVVGGIGIMNIMLVSVTERTREIGVRMAVGARPRDILAQFLVESLTLSVIGGLIGVAGGILTAERLAARFGWPVVIRPDIVLLAVGVSALVGIVFGIYPARKASLLDPIEALRYE